MSEVTNQVDVSASAQTSANQAAAVQNSSAGQQVGGASASFNGSSTIKSMNELREKAPKVYNSMLQGIAMNICNEMKHHQENLKEMMRKGRET